jgi:hypothetical protein
MQFRLGEYECAKCRSEEMARRAFESGKPEQIRPPPNISPVESMRHQPPASHIQRGESPRCLSPPKSLIIEKVVILAIMALAMLLAFALPAPFVLAVGIAFFTQIVWLKWSCFGCSITASIFLIPLALLCIEPLQDILRGHSAEPGGEGAFFLVLLVTFATYGLLGPWIASVLYRDIQILEPHKPSLSFRVMARLSGYLVREKVLLVIVYLALTIYGVVSGSYEEMLSPALSCVLLAIVLFIPIMWLKYAAFAFVAVNILSFLFGLMLIVFLDLISPQLAAKAFPDTVPTSGWIVIAFQVPVIWAATLLYRDIGWLKRQR